MPKEAKRRFVELSVGEVSLVDSPANEEEFAVIKSLNAQEDEMPDDKTEVSKAEGDDTKANDKAEAAATEDGGQVETVPVEVDKAEDAAVQKAMDKVIELVENIAKETKATPVEDTEESDAEKAKKASPFSGTGIRELYKSQLTKAGVKGDALKSAMSEFDKAAEKAKPPWLKAKKDEAGDAVSTDTEKADTEAGEGLLEELSAAIEKAKRFTPKRADALKAAIETLSKLAEELGTEKKTAPAKGTAPGGASFGESGIKQITKSIEGLADTFKTALDEVVETSKGLTERVDAIEKERTPSQSVDEDGGTDTKTEKSKSMWNGVL